MPDTKRIHYLDNIRIYLTVIVILQHLAITYGAPGGWYYREFDFHQLDTITLAALVLLFAFWRFLNTANNSPWNPITIICIRYLSNPEIY